ncbi:phytanoyl-CoA dioxygenase family protein [Parasphingopyxis marina]|uniref:Phytanoyl-CoA dioxygenase family protein n=1 Tax=Parasphingopyxis marina TaxID=2761622 RepID=A0A842HYB1_9SPHN|nr:phytanoyl-CoA dioxygenase family protein [Parasphingopyxis marina]MBC2777423.1 phytanoyl-CoA dioxygenase family protein [Parasphingopyxis marina]
MNPARYLLAPWWLAQLATGAKNFSKNPLIGSKRLNACGLHVSRVKHAHAMAAKRRARLARLIDPAEREAFDRNGFVEKRDFLPAEEFARLRDTVLAYRGPARDMVQGDTITRRFAIDPKLLAAIPDLRSLLAHPEWRGLIRYAGSFDQEPLNYIQSILSHVREADPDPQTHFHADTFHPTVKAWLFLTDVAEDEGPFCYVPGSHRLTPERLEWERQMSLKAPEGLDRLSSRGSFRVTPAELPALGLPPPRQFAVPANTLVVGDTFGFHARGPSVRPSTRVEIWAYGRRNPYLPWTGLDPLSLPGIAERRITALWRFRDRFRRFTGQPWRDVGDKTPTER